MGWFTKKEKVCNKCKKNYLKDLDQILRAYSNGSLREGRDHEMIKNAIYRMERDILALRHEYEFTHRETMFF